jgi:hypothetical protein
MRFIPSLNAWNCIAAGVFAAGILFQTTAKAEQSEQGDVPVRCLIVPLSGEQGRQLIPSLDRFAANEQMELDHTATKLYRYFKTNGNQRAEMSYRTHIGKTALLAVYAPQQEFGDWLKRLDALLVELGEQLSLRSCS